MGASRQFPRLQAVAKNGFIAVALCTISRGIAAYATRAGTRSAYPFGRGPNLASHRREKSASIARSCLVVLVPDSRRLTRKAYLWICNQTIRESDLAPDRLPALSAASFLNFILDRIALRHVEVRIGGGDGRERPGLIIGGDKLRCD